MQGKDLVLNVGYSQLKLKQKKALLLLLRKTTVKVSGVSKEQVGAIASNIRSVRPPEPYKGKGIRYQGEYVRRKEGKTGK